MEYTYLSATCVLQRGIESAQEDTTVGGGIDGYFRSYRKRLYRSRSEGSVYEREGVGRGSNGVRSGYTPLLCPYHLG